MIKALSQIDFPYILYSQEDYWIQKPVEQILIEDYLDIIRSGKADYIRLYPAPPPDLPFPDDHRLGIIAPTSPYRTSLQMALWRKETLLSLLDTHETAWEFEVKGSKRSQYLKKRFLCVSKRQYGIDYVFTAVVNGYWSEKAYQYADNEKIHVRFEALPRKSIMVKVKDTIVSRLYRVKKKFLSKIRSIKITNFPS